MPTFKFEKLVRDKLPTMYEQMGQRIMFRTLSGTEFLEALRAKLVEEATEIPVEKGARERAVQELSDVVQVVEDMKDKFGVSTDEIEEARQEKLSKKGGFSSGTFVETISLDDNDEWVDYYRQDPSKYPEVEG